MQYEISRLRGVENTGSFQGHVEAGEEDEIACRLARMQHYESTCQERNRTPRRNISFPLP